jgi:outer membrane lipoprotein SlyB
MSAQIQEASGVSGLTHAFPMKRSARNRLVVLLFGLGVAACAGAHSPDQYATAAVQQVNPVERGTILGARLVQVAGDGTAGGAAGAAVGGAIGSQVPFGQWAQAAGAAIVGAFGSVLGAAAERSMVGMPAYEYIILTDAGTERAVTQNDASPLQRQQRVIIIGGQQARVISEGYAPPLEQPRPADRDMDRGGTVALASAGAEAHCIEGDGCRPER